MSKQMSENFISMKKMEARLNLKESEFGQKFSNWHVFVHTTRKGSYGDIILYQKSQSGTEDKFILSKSATLDRNDSLLTLTLNGGSVYALKGEKLTQVNYEKLQMKYNPKLHELHSSEILDFWKEAATNPSRAKYLAFSVMVSLFPLLTFLFALSFGIAHMRHHKPNVYLNSMIVVILYYVAIYQVSYKFPLYGSMVVALLFASASAFFFKKRIMERF